MARVLYHYTDASGADGIESTGVIYASENEGPFASFGYGAYLTDLKPTVDSEEIARLIYDGNRLRSRKRSNLDYVVKLVFPKRIHIKKVNVPRHIWLYPFGDLDLDEVCFRWKIMDVEDVQNRFYDNDYY